MEKGKAQGKTSPQDARGASQPAGKGGQAEAASTGSLANFVRKQKRKRWHRHLQRVCGTKQIWEVLAFSGRFEVEMLVQALYNQPSGETAEPADRDQVSDELRRRLHHEKAEAIARYLEGSRIAQLRDAGKKVDEFSRWQQEVLQKWDSGQLRRDRNQAAVAVGHGRLENANGDYLDIGGSTGGGSRRILDDWQPPCWRTFLQEDAWQ